MRTAIILGLGWLALTGAVLGKTMLKEGAASSLTRSGGAADGTDPASTLDAANADAPAPEPTRRPIDLEMDGLSPARRVEIVEYALLNGTALRQARRTGDTEIEDVVTLGHEAKPFSVMVRFRRSWFPSAAPGVVGPFCGRRVDYELALFDGSSPSDYNMSEVHPVSFLLACDRGDHSRNARSFDEFSATGFLVGIWGFKAQCGGEAYELSVNFVKGLPSGTSSTGQVLGVSIDRIEEPQWKGMMQVARDRDTGQLVFTWSEDERALHGIDRRFEFRSPSVGANADSMHGDVLAADEGIDQRMCGTWVAAKVSPPTQ